MPASFLTLWETFAPSDLPKPRAHFQFDKNLNYHLDWAFADARCMVGVELNRNVSAEVDKYNAAAAEGWRVIHLTSQKLTQNPQRCVELVVKALKML